MDSATSSRQQHALPESPESLPASRLGTLPHRNVPATAPTAADTHRARRPLRLLDLPVDILKDIIHQVTSPVHFSTRHTR